MRKQKKERKIKKKFYALAIILFLIIPFTAHASILGVIITTAAKVVSSVVKSISGSSSSSSASSSSSSSSSSSYTPNSTQQFLADVANALLTIANTGKKVVITGKNSFEIVTTKTITRQATEAEIESMLIEEVSKRTGLTEAQLKAKGLNMDLLKKEGIIAFGDIAKVNGENPTAKYGNFKNGEYRYLGYDQYGNLIQNPNFPDDVKGSQDFHNKNWVTADTILNNKTLRALIGYNGGGSTYDTWDAGNSGKEAIAQKFLDENPEFKQAGWTVDKVLKNFIIQEGTNGSGVLTGVHKTASGGTYYKTFTVSQDKIIPDKTITVITVETFEYEIPKINIPTYPPNTPSTPSTPSTPKTPSGGSGSSGGSSGGNSGGSSGGNSGGSTTPSTQQDVTGYLTIKHMYNTILLEQEVAVINIPPNKQVKAIAKPKNILNYKTNESPKEVFFTQDAPYKTVVFNYDLDKIEIETDLQGLVEVVYKVKEDGKVLGTDKLTASIFKGRTADITAVAKDFTSQGYVLDDKMTKKVTLSETAPYHEVIFYYKKAQTKLKATVTTGDIVVKSGHGFELDVSTELESSFDLDDISGTIYAEVTTNFDKNTYRMEWVSGSKDKAKLQLEKNKNSVIQARKIYTDPSLPDGEYEVKITVKGLKTPLGEVAPVTLTKKVTVKGTMYDDDYTTAK